MRDVDDLAEEFPGEAEVTAFTSTLIPLLAEAMHLRGRPLADAEYYDQSRPLQQQIVDLIEQPAQHLGVRQVQGIFRDNAHRLYHWVENRAVPADNNRAERELRPTVIARKVSFGSQSDAGAKTREVLMSVVHTLVKRSLIRKSTSRPCSTNSRPIPPKTPWLCCSIPLEPSAAVQFDAIQRCALPLPHPCAQTQACP